jgi:hypothetical protein
MFSNAQQNVPPLFREIIRNQAERRALTAGNVVPFSVAPEVRRLRKEMDDYRGAAEKALRWNLDASNNARG